MAVRQMGLPGSQQTQVDPDQRSQTGKTGENTEDS